MCISFLLSVDHRSVIKIFNGTNHLKYLIDVRRWSNLWNIPCTMLYLTLHVEGLVLIGVGYDSSSKQITLISDSSDSSCIPSMHLTMVVIHKFPFVFGSGSYELETPMSAAAASPIHLPSIQQLKKDASSLFLPSVEYLTVDEFEAIPK